MIVCAQLRLDDAIRDHTGIGQNQDADCTLVEALNNANNNAQTHAGCAAGQGGDGYQSDCRGETHIQFPLVDQRTQQPRHLDGEDYRCVPAIASAGIG